MPKLLVAADDLTGALDTGIQFAKRGIETGVFISVDIDFNGIDGVAEVAVVNTKSRHLPPCEAYRVVYDLIKEAKNHGFDYFYKKTDSALRGNVGAELSAMWSALDEPVAFVPAYPKMGRTTVDGIHYVDGIPVAETPFGHDPFTPVLSSRVREILLKSGAAQDAVIEVFDAETDGELLQIEEVLLRRKAKALAGCAGFAAHLPDMIDFYQREIMSPCNDKGLLVVTGSVNPVTLKQVDRAEQSGFSSLVVPREIKISSEKEPKAVAAFTGRAIADFLTGGRLIVKSIEAGGKDFIATGEEGLHGRIARNIGGIAAALMERLDARFFLIGGDILIEAIEQLNPDNIEPLSEPVPGVVFAKLRKAGREIDLYTKSGGFGDSDVILKIDKMKKDEEMRDETE